MNSVIRDGRYAVRMFLQNPGLVAVAVLSLGLGIGANTTIFSVINAILLRPLRFENPDRLVILYETNRQEGGWRNPRLSTSLEWMEKTRSFEQMEMAVAYLESNTLSGSGEAERVTVQFLSRNLFSLLGVKPALGRGFLPEEVLQDASTAVLISHGLWQRRFGGDPDILGKSLTLEGGVRTVIGIMPPGFWIFPWTKNVDIWTALNLTNNKLTPDTRWLSPLARLKSGISIEQAHAEMDVFARQLEQAYPQTNKGWGVSVEPLHKWFFEGFDRILYLLLGAVGFVLLIACANVANLLLARGATREKEIAIRASLGAGRLRLMRQLLTESVLLALLGGVLGILLSVWGIRIFVALAPDWFPRAEEIRVDGMVLGFTLGISLLTGILFGLAPAFQASRPDLNESLKEGGRRSTAGSRQLTRGLLVVSEVALALMLLVGAGLMINSFLRLQRVDPGFNPDNLLTAGVELSAPKYRELIGGDMKRVTPQVDLFYQQVLDRLKTLPGAKSVGLASRMMPYPFRIVGRPDPPPREQPRAALGEVNSDYFRTMQVPLLKGRGLTERDGEAAPWVVVINEEMARRYFPDEDPIGKLIHVKFGDLSGLSVEEDRPREIVGVVGNVKHWGLRGNPFPSMYVPYRQHIWEYPGGTSRTHLVKNFFIRTASDPMSLAGAVRAAVAEADKDQAVHDIMSMEQVLSEWLAPQRFWMRLYGIFALLAAILAAVGIYGVMSYSVSRRTHEFGVRLAMGAGKGDVVKLVVRQGLKLTLIGVAVGAAGAFALTRLIARFLYGVTATDPMTFASVALVLTGVALAASYIPARRATRVDPMVALRYE